MGLNVGTYSIGRGGIRTGFLNAVWKPTDLGSALVAAYDPTDSSTLTMSGGTVSQMRDIGPNGYHLVQATSAKQPTYSATGFMGKPGLLLDGTDDYMQADNVNLGTTAFAAFAFTQQHYGSTTNCRLLAYQGTGQANDFVSPGSVLLIANNGGTTNNIGGYRGVVKSTFLYTGIEPTDGGFYRIGSVWDATNNTILVDNQAQTAVASSGSLASPGSLRFGAYITGTNTWKGAASRMVLMNRAPTTAEQTQIDNWLQSPWTRFVCVEGDSKATFGTPDANALPTNYSFVVIPNLTPPAIVRNRAIGGSSINNGTDTVAGINHQLTVGNRGAWADSTLPADKAGRIYILVVDIGSNDDITNSEPPATMASQMATYCAARKAAGWDKIVLCTLLSRTDSSATQANFDTARNGYNAIIKGTGWAAANSVDAICDFASDSIMGVNAAPSVNSSYFVDGVHPNAAGNARMEPILREVINGL